MIDAGTLGKEDEEAPTNVAQSIASLYEGPEQGGADSSKTTQGQMQAVLDLESVVMLSPSPAPSLASVKSTSKISRAQTQAAQKACTWSA